MNSAEKFNGAVRPLQPSLKEPLLKIRERDKNGIFEIRLRAGLPVSLVNSAGCNFLSLGGDVSPFIRPNSAVIASAEDVQTAFERFCGYSVYAHKDEINNGYISVAGGHRVGVCGRAVYSGGAISSVADISSLNIRIAREVLGAGERYLPYAEDGLLIAGAPGSGKTTVLRDIARAASLSGKRVAVIDTRREIAACHNGTSSYDLGANCDVLTGYTKTDGIDIAVRTLNPQIVFFDELSALKESERIIDGFFCGTAFVCTVHAHSEDELYSKEITEKLLSAGAVSNILFLGGVGQARLTVACRGGRKCV